MQSAHRICVWVAHDSTPIDFLENLGGLDSGENVLRTGKNCALRVCILMQMAYLISALWSAVETGVRTRLAPASGD